MNLSLLDPFAVAKEYPELLTQTLSYGHSTNIRSSPSGSYLASGLVDGTIIIIDNDTNSTITILRDHTRAITSLSWSQCGRYLLSSSRDWKVNLWDLGVSGGAIVKSYTFEGPVWNCELLKDGDYEFEFVCALLEDDPVYVKFRLDDDGERDRVVKMETNPVVDEDEYDNNSEDNNNNNSDSDGNERVKKKRKVITGKHWTLTCGFSRCHKYIFNGTSKGWLNIIDRTTLEIIKSIKICNSNIKSIEFSNIGNKVAINSSDRVIRQFRITTESGEGGDGLELELENKYQDAVNRLQWNSVKFNNTSEYLCASTLGATHDIYIWETSMGSLIKILEGSNEELIEVDWNYRRCSIVATGMDSGMLYVWSIVIPQKWSALAPDFEEIEENIDYEEKEDEFDFVDYEDDLNKIIEEEEKEVIDVLTVEKVDARGFPFIQNEFVIDVCLEPNAE